MTIIEQHALGIAVLLWLSGVTVGAIVSSALTMYYVYRKGQQWTAEREEE